jgi:hypothetical protein
MTKYLKSAYQFGALGGVLSVISFYALSFLYPDPTNLNLLFGYILVPVSIFLSIKFFKDDSNGGFLSFSEGMTVGFVTYILLGILSMLGIWLILNLSPDLFEVIRTTKLEVLLQSKDTIVSQVGEDSYMATAASMEKLSTWDIAFNDAIWKIVPGMFFSIIISIIFRKNTN